MNPRIVYSRPAINPFARAIQVVLLAALAFDLVLTCEWITTWCPVVLLCGLLWAVAGVLHLVIWAFFAALLENWRKPL